MLGDASKLVRFSKISRVGAKDVDKKNLNLLSGVGLSQICQIIPKGTQLFCLKQINPGK